MKTKDRILMAAIDLFAKKGFTETTMRDIAAASDIRASSIYNYFPSKQDILTYIINIYKENTNSQIRAEEDWVVFIEEHSAEEVLEALFFVFEGESAPMMRDILRIFLQEQFRVPEVNRFMRKIYLDGVEQMIAAAITLLQEQGKLSPAVDAALNAHILSSLNMTATLELGFLQPEEVQPPKEGPWMRSVNMMIRHMLDTPWPKED